MQPVSAGANASGFAFARLRNGVQLRVNGVVKNVLFYGPDLVRVNANLGRTFTTQPSLVVEETAFARTPLHGGRLVQIARSPRSCFMQAFAWKPTGETITKGNFQDVAGCHAPINPQTSPSMKRQTPRLRSSKKLSVFRAAAFSLVELLVNQLRIGTLRLSEVKSNPAVTSGQPGSDDQDENYFPLPALASAPSEITFNVDNQNRDVSAAGEADREVTMQILNPSLLDDERSEGQPPEAWQGEDGKGGEIAFVCVSIRPPRPAKESALETVFSTELNLLAL